ncbi:hypothetical protein R75461_07236 [Paraburkholderia nemoris]|uniref:fimbrial protein n=1 Tax=Paraburkholderia nemoris TaxID=2793076 RepID=UPI00190DF12B|nr:MULTISPECIES: fimbrial protein [Paraburkholderia]MBK3787091.1 fimbrial protein [Paraburkholderia aspalathi]CAE6845587.1 hypothetical protein R75461_07236 [Paraburkholderia nemoris]
MNMNMMKKLLQLWLLAVILVMPGWAQATCIGAPFGSIIVFPSTIIKFDPNASPGTVIGTLSAIVPSTLSDVCKLSVGLFWYQTYGGASVGAYNTVPTGVPGIGVTFSSGSGSSLALPAFGTSGIGLPTSDGGIDFTAYSPIIAQFIITGPASAGSSPGPWAIFQARQPGDNATLASFQAAGAITFVPYAPTCTVATPSITVSLGNIPLNQFTGVGTTTTAVPFYISLTCTGGAGGSTSIYTTLTDQTDLTNVSTTLNRTPDSTATGLGIQVLNQGTPVGYGPDSNVHGNTNQWLAGSTAVNGTSTIHLSARYIQTGPVQPGSANGRATFTMSYQ